MSFEDRFGLLVDQEWISRKNNHLKRLIKQAKFAESGACVEDIEYHAARNLDQTQIARLSTYNFITERHNVLLLGATAQAKRILPVRSVWRRHAAFFRYDTPDCQSCSLSLPLLAGTERFPKLYSSTRNRRFSFLTNGFCIRSRKPKREIFSRLQRRDTKRHPQYYALSLTSPAGGKRSVIPYSPTTSVTASFTIPTASLLTAKNPCANEKASKKTKRKEPPAHRALPEPEV